MQQERQYGRWDSPLTADVLAKTNSIGSTRVHEPSGLIFVDEAQPDGRRGILEIDESGHDVRSILPPPYNVGSAVYEYGGGAWTVNKAGNIIFSDTSGNAVCLLDRRLSTVTRVLEDPNLRFADFDPHPVDSRWVAAIQEDHKEPGSSKVRHRLVLIDMEEGEYQILHEQHDFYSHVRFAPDGKQICWLSWEHPHMPFTGAVLRVASFDLHSRRITGEKGVGSKPAERSIGQPRWHDDGTLYFLDTSSGYWQLYSYRTGQEHPDHVRIEGMDDCDLGNAEFGLGSCSFQCLGNRIVFAYVRHAISYIGLADLESDFCETLDLPLVHIVPDGVRRVSYNKFLLVGETLDEPTALYLVTLREKGGLQQALKIRSSLSIGLPCGIFSKPQPFSCPRTYGPHLDGLVRGFLLSPYNPEYVAPQDALPPLLVYAHGGPTNHASPGCSLDAQYWTSRGYAVLMLNYAGSTGYGLDYQRRLDGFWGIADSADACSAAAYLINESIVDGSRVGLVGPSAGGYLTLKAVCDEPALWAAGISLFGISDTRAFAATTHKFESHYTNLLIFAHHEEVIKSEEEMARIHVERSPLHHVNRIKAPLLLLQGTEDWVVRPQQATDMHDALQRQGRTSESVFFSGEGHSYWKGEAWRRSLIAQEQWWKKYLLRLE